MLAGCLVVRLLTPSRALFQSNPSGFITRTPGRCDCLLTTTGELNTGRESLPSPPEHRQQGPSVTPSVCSRDSRVPPLDPVRSTTKSWKNLGLLREELRFLCWTFQFFLMVRLPIPIKRPMSAFPSLNLSQECLRDSTIF
jgi:hypothetical protein